MGAGDASGPAGGSRERDRSVSSVRGVAGGKEDRRAIPLLNRALLSRDHLIQAEAAEGLALFGDKASIPLILEACRKAPARAAGLIAASLVYFDDPAAQAAVDQFLPEKEARDLRERVRAGGRPLHLHQ